MSKVEKYDWVRLINDENNYYSIGLVLNKVKNSVMTVFSKIDQNLKIYKLPNEKIETLKEEEIKDFLNYAKDNQRKFPFFISILNDIDELKKYHIKEEDFIKNVRKSIKENKKNLKDIKVKEINLDIAIECSSYILYYDKNHSWGFEVHLNDYEFEGKIAYCLQLDDITGLDIEEKWKIFNKKTNERLYNHIKAKALNYIEDKGLRSEYDEKR